MSARSTADLPICPRCGRLARVILDEPAGHEVRDPKAADPKDRKWKPAQACSKCVDLLRAGKVPKQIGRAANDTTERAKRPGQPATRMTQIDLFSEEKKA